MRIILTLFCFGLCAHTAAQTNIFTNAGFETFAGATCPPHEVYRTGSTPAGGGWSIERGTPDHLCSYMSGAYGFELPHQYRADVAHSGNGYALLFGAASGTPEAYRYAPASPLLSGVSYTFTFWAKRPMHLEGGVFLLKGASGTTYASQSVNGMSNWTGFAVTFNPDVDEPYLLLTTATGDAGVALDDLSLSATSPLMLHIRWFTGAVRGRDAMLEWEMTEEHGLQAFSVERSLDGRSFQRVGHYPATTGFTTRYALTDTAIPAGHPVHYRLRVLELNGASRYSSTLSLQRPDEAPRPLTLSPNPARNVLKVSGFYEPARVRIFSAEGRLMMSIENVAEGDAVDVSSLPRGIYFLECRGARHTVTERFLKS